MKIKNLLVYRFEEHFDWCLKNKSVKYNQSSACKKHGEFYCLKSGRLCNPLNCREMHSMDKSNESAESFWNKKY